MFPRPHFIVDCFNIHYKTTEKRPMQWKFDECVVASLVGLDPVCCEPPEPRALRGPLLCVPVRDASTAPGAF